MAGRSESLQLSVSRREDAQLIQLRGELDLQTAPRLREMFDGLLKPPPPRLLIDLSGVSYIDSSGVGTIVYMKRELERLGGRVVLSGLQVRVRSVFEITQLDRFFSIAETVEEALRR